MKLADIRAARSWFAGHFNVTYPFATLALKTDGVDLAVAAGADLLIGNKGGQLAWNSIIGDRFKEFEYEDNLAVRWHAAGVDSAVVIDPRIRFGAPQVGGVPTYLLRDRWVSGEPLDEMVDDFGISKKLVQDALRFEGLNPNSARKNDWLN